MPARTRAGLALSEVVSTGLGTAHRDDPVSGRTGGPAGNARLTAWTGLLLLAAFGAECATLLGLRQLIGVHILVGAFLVPPALLKTGTTMHATSRTGSRSLCPWAIGRVDGYGRFAAATACAPGRTAPGP